MATNRLVLKLNEAFESKKFYEAHQLLKTINFRYFSSQKFTDLEKLLYSSSILLLENNQIESGSDVAIMLAKLYNSDVANLQVTKERIDDSIRILVSLPDSPERLNYTGQIIEWSSKSTSHLRSDIHKAIAKIHLNEGSYSEAWKNLIRINDGNDAAALAIKISSENFIPPEEFDLLVAHLILSFLAGNKIDLAEQSFKSLVKDKELTPLLNGLRFILEAAKTRDAKAFSSILELYSPSFSRHPPLRKKLRQVGKNIFNLPDNNERGGMGGFMPMFLNAFLQPPPPPSEPPQEHQDNAGLD